MDLMQRRRVMLAAGKKPRLPRKYQETEYLESSGTQYILTNLFPQNNYDYFIRAIKFRSNDRCAFFEARWSGSPTFDTFGFYWGEHIVFYYGRYSANEYYDYGEKNDLINTIFDASIEHNKITFNGTTIRNITIGPLTSTYPFALFGMNYGGSIVQLLIGRIYYFRIEENGRILNYFIPCYRKSDNKPGMYDLCGSICPLTNSPFYINAGTDEFLVGPDVN